MIYVMIAIGVVIVLLSIITLGIMIYDLVRAICTRPWKDRYSDMSVSDNRNKKLKQLGI